ACKVRLQVAAQIALVVPPRVRPDVRLDVALGVGVGELVERRLLAHDLVVAPADLAQALREQLIRVLARAGHRLPAAAPLVIAVVQYPLVAAFTNAGHGRPPHKSYHEPAASVPS